MKKMTSRGLTGFLLAAALLLGSTTAGHTGELRCMSDPVVVLSDGTTIDLTASIGTELWNVQSIEYTLRVPAGRYPVLVVRTPNWPTTLEKFTIVSDQPANRYEAATVVKTRVKGVSVEARLLVGARLSTTTGWDSQRLRTIVQTSGLL